ncbi:MAG: hypothetical protein KatS3mg058_0473 [Roseiflexus sp.]|nr:MAG: hypothetical protein KatS3mg058_0473 [Roseiflexus sp.]
MCAVWRHLIVSVTPGSQPIRIDARATLLLEEEPRVRLAALSLSQRLHSACVVASNTHASQVRRLSSKKRSYPKPSRHSAIKARSIRRQSFLGTAGIGTPSFIAGTQPTAQPDGSVLG